MPTKLSILTLLLAGLLGFGCATEGDASRDDIYTEDYYQDGSAQMPVQSARSATNGAGMPAAPSVEGVRFRRYTEQREQAYSFEAPEGWRVEAQIIRSSPTLYRAWNVFTSPEGQLHIAGGSPERHLFMEPSQMTQRMGLREGATLDGTTYVARYQNAMTFAQQNVQAITGGCGGLEITGQQERPDEAQRQEAKARREGDWVNGMRINAGEITFRCQGPNGPVEGRVIAVTVHMERPGSGSVWFGSLRGYLAPPQRAEEAYRIMEHIVQTQQTNPQWKARQRQVHLAQMQANQQAHQAQMQASQQAHQQRMAQNQAAFNAHQQRMADQRATFDSHNESWQANQAARDHMHDQFIGSIRDETRVWDTNTGQSYDVPYGSDSYYIDDSGSTIVGTPGYVGNPDPSTYNPMYEGYDYNGNDR